MEWLRRGPFRNNGALSEESVDREEAGLNGDEISVNALEKDNDSKITSTARGVNMVSALPPSSLVEICVFSRSLLRQC